MIVGFRCQRVLLNFQILYSNHRKHKLLDHESCVDTVSYSVIGSVDWFCELYRQKHSIAEDEGTKIWRKPLSPFQYTLTYRSVEPRAQSHDREHCVASCPHRNRYSRPNCSWSSLWKGSEQTRSSDHCPESQRSPP